MNNAIDHHINNFNKGFLTTPNGGYEDPTFLGFRLIFDFDPVHRDFDTMLTNDPLFSTNDNLESAQRYLKAVGYPKQAEMLNAFKENLRYLTQNSPWYFQTLTGLGDLWKIEHGENFNNYRGKDKFLDITCLESIDMRMTALADLYRKATFDPKFMRNLLPENLKWFTLKVQVAEIRSFHRVAGSVAKISTGTNPNNAETKATNFNPNNQLQLEYINDLISIVEFQLEKCEFDFNDSFPSDGTLSMDGDMQQAKMKFKIKVRSIKEQNNYKILDLILKDGRGSKVGNKFSGGAAKTTSDEFEGRVPDMDAAFNKKANNIVSKSANLIASDLDAKLREVAGLPANLAARGVNNIEAKVTGQILGNVYDDARNQSIAGILNGFTNQNQQFKISEDVYENVPGSDLSTKNTLGSENVYDK